MDMEKIKLIEEEDGSEHTETILKKDKTGRGFGIINFTDKYGSDCSLQDSSIATEPAIWFGVSVINLQTMDSNKCWIPFEIPNEVLVNSRMHLTQAMVRQLLPYLTKFAESGEYIANMEIK